MRRSLLITPPLLALLAACGTRPAPATSTTTASATPPPAASSPAPVAPAPRPTLVTEQLRLAELFRGTPVVFAMQQDGSLRATVPLRYCFDPGAARVKPALAAVLDRLAKSQLGRASRFRLAAPADAPARNAALARDRAASLRAYLAAQGIETARLLLATGAAQTVQAEIVISEMAPH